MKLKLSFCLLLFTIVFAGAKAQSLEFSQIANIDRTYQIPLSSSTPFDSLVVTIPTGKVWKITGARMAYSYMSGGEMYVGSGSGESIFLDNMWLFQGYSTAGYHMEWPIWLGAGTYTFKAKSSQYGATFNIHWLISIIEFNVVP